MMLEEDTCFSTSKNVLWFISKCLLLREQYWSVRLPKWHSGKNSPANVGIQEMLFRSLGQEDTLEKEMGTHSGILAWRIP